MTSAAPGHIYALFGLIVRSQIPLPMGEVAAAGPADVDVAYGRIDLPAQPRWGYAEVDGGTLLSVEDVGRFLIRDGARILVDPDPAGSERNIRLFLLGSAFGALLHQRGLMPLHANAVVLGGRAFAFCGHSGAGKSTMAAWFHDQGHPILADDVCVLGFDAAGAPLAYPGVPRLRLWREALEEFGRRADDYQRSFDDMDKYDVPIAGEGGAAEPVPLAAVYLLAKAEEGAAAGSIQRLTGIAAVDALVANTYRGFYLEAIGGTGPHLATCVRLARTVPVFRAARVWGFDSFAAEAARLDAHARDLGQGAR
ncbi:MAG: hypothetical protein JO013_09265 [Alphaproteobacteria bacterium]|nr:hypothetical protein [Alphaproteobacteria bacterium]